MARKVFKAGDVKLHVITSMNGVIIIKVIDKASNEILDEKAFNAVDFRLENFVAQYMEESLLAKLIDYLNKV